MKMTDKPNKSGGKPVKKPETKVPAGTFHFQAEGQAKSCEYKSPVRFTYERKDTYANPDSCSRLPQSIRSSDALRGDMEDRKLDLIQTEPNNLKVIVYTYVPGKGKKVISLEEALKQAHVSVFFDAQDREVKREKYDEKGDLREITIYDYEKDKLKGERFYDTELKFCRKRNPSTGIMEELDASGNLIRTLEE